MPKPTTAAEAGPPLSLSTKVQPSQTRARNTFESVLKTAGELLAEVGFERLTTNLVCERAGITPPALYRYFPNKYAILGELSRRLMEALDAAVSAWMQAGGLETVPLDEKVRRICELQKQLNEITRQMPGGVWIMRALRAIPALHEIRTATRDRVATRLTAALSAQHPAAPERELFQTARLTTELMYAAMELVLEESGQDEAQINAEVCLMVGLHYQHLPHRYA